MNCLEIVLVCILVSIDCASLWKPMDAELRALCPKISQIEEDFHTDHGLVQVYFCV